MKPNMTAHEGAEQATLFNWAKMKAWEHPELNLMFHVPNGGKRSATEAKRFQAEGVKPGVPDIFLPVPHGEYHGLFIEMKRREGGKVSANQSEWITNLQEQGYRVEVCKGWEAAAAVIEDYLNG